jgi:NAD(P)-dependent dehydrogenase (short-subunit alcohol dehydrogenase family)
MLLLLSSNAEVGSTSFCIKSLDKLISPGYAVFATLLPHEPREHLTNFGVQVFSADVTSDTEIEKLQETISNITDGRLDVLVNCA